MKIAILGHSGSGKSTLAGYLGKKYNIPVLYLDKVQFLPDWKERNREEAKTMVTEFMTNDSWVIDGNYSDFLQEERLEQADKIIYLNFNRFSCLYRVIKRYLTHRNKTRESVATGCIEKIDKEFIWWVLYEGRNPSRRLRYHQITETFKEKTVVIHNQRQLNLFISSI